MAEFKIEQTKRNLIKVGIIFTSVVAFITAAFFIYFGIHYDPDEYAYSFLKSDEEIKYTQTSKYEIFEPISEYSDCFIFYPGAKVEAQAYAPLASSLAHKGIYTVICNMTLNFPIFSKNAADEILETKSNLNISIGGHSLGGVMSARYTLNHPNQIKNLILLASYSDVDWTSISVNCLSIYGNNDKVLNYSSYEENKTNLPNLTKKVIEGGIHSYFGSYGIQKGDGTPKITLEEQTKLTSNYIYDFIK